MRVLKLQLVKCVPQLPPVITSDCKYHHNPTSSPVPQTHERKVAPVNSESPHTDNPVRPSATPPAKTYVLPKTSLHSLNLQVELTSLTSLTSIATSSWTLEQLECSSIKTLYGNTSLRPLHSPSPSCCIMYMVPPMNMAPSQKNSMPSCTLDNIQKEHNLLSPT